MVNRIIPYRTYHVSTAPGEREQLKNNIWAHIDHIKSKFKQHQNFDREQESTNWSKQTKIRTEQDIQSYEIIIYMQNRYTAVCVCVWHFVWEFEFMREIDKDVLRLWHEIILEWNVIEHIFALWWKNNWRRKW